MASEQFRANVGIVLVNHEKQVLIFERVDVAGAWQLPQGGIDAGETPLRASERELYEETGLSIDQVTLLGEYPEWLAYQFPDSAEKGPYLGQVQRWFVYRLDVDTKFINLGAYDIPEFADFRWVDAGQLEAIAVSFRKPIYRRLAAFIETL